MIQRILPIALLGSAALFADEISVSGPMMGMVSAADGIRPVLGFPGAAYVGAVLPLDVTPDSVMIAPELSYALFSAAGKLMVLDGSIGKIVVREVTGTAGVASAWFSPAGKSALLLSADGVTAQLLTGLPAGPRITAVFTVSDGLKVAAVSDDAQHVLTSSSAGLLTQWDGDGTLRGTIAIRGVLALQFFNQSSDALVASRSDGKLYKLRDSGDVVFVRDVDAIAVATSNDDSVIYAASAAGQLLAIRDTGELIGSYSPPITPTRVRRMGGVFSLNEYDGGPLAIFDGSQMWMIPPAKDGGAQ